MAAAALTLLLTASIAFPASLPPTPFRSETLPNGLRVLLVERHEAPVVDVQVWYHVGSKDEPPGRTGFAHLFEHLMFQGTRNVGPEQFSDYIVRSGGIDNAYTTEDTTVFWETIPSSQLAVALWLEADRMRGLDITEKAFSTEREVVKEERRSRFDNQPYGTVIESLYKLAFSVHPYQHTPIGSMEDLDRARVEDIRDFYNTYYVPNNATLVIVGDFDAKEAASLVEKYFGRIDHGPDLKDRAIPQEPPQKSKRSVQARLAVALPAFVAGYHMPADGTPDAYPLRLAARILSDGDSSRIYRRLVYDKQIALQAETTGNFTEDPNLFFVLAIMNGGHTPVEAEREIEAELERLKTEPVSSQELTKAKNQILRDFVESRQSVQSLGDELGYASVVLKDPNLLDAELERFLAVTPEDIQRVAKKYIVPENETVLEVLPLNKGVANRE
ncbi:MAG: M16 family metallopeptidase [Terriglobia bacterium]